jgi:SAM-dependent methyltransferase
MLGTGDLFHYSICASCGSRSLADPPIDMTPYYPATYGPFVPRTGAIVALRRRFLADDKWRALRRINPQREWRVLDVGSGAGEFLRSLEARGFRHLTGVDPFLPREVRAEGRFRIIKGSVRDLAGEDFDLVTMHHVIEHAPDTREFLANVASLLASGGLILVRTPLVDSWAARTYGARWVQHDAPRHHVLLTSLGLERAAAAAGLFVADSWRDEGRWQAWAGATLAAGGDPFRAKPFAVRLGGLRYAHSARRRNAQRIGDSGCFVLRRP